VDNCKDDFKTGQAAAGHEDEGDCSGCSPFITCCSCAGVAFPTSSYLMSAPVIALTERLSEYQSFFSSEFSCSIWQPPKFS